MQLRHPLLHITFAVATVSAVALSAPAQAGLLGSGSTNGAAGGSVGRVGSVGIGGGASGQVGVDRALPRPDPRLQQRAAGTVERGQDAARGQADAIQQRTREQAASARGRANGLAGEATAAGRAATEAAPSGGASAGAQASREERAVRVDASAEGGTKNAR